VLTEIDAYDATLEFLNAFMRLADPSTSVGHLLEEMPRYEFDVAYPGADIGGYAHWADWMQAVERVLHSDAGEQRGAAGERPASNGDRRAIKWKHVLTEMDAYDAMLEFLNAFMRLTTPSTSLADLLEEMYYYEFDVARARPDVRDYAHWAHWVEAVERVLQRNTGDQL
jgi:hypothetical protein